MRNYLQILKLNNGRENMCLKYQRPVRHALSAPPNARSRAKKQLGFRPLCIELAVRWCEKDCVLVCKQRVWYKVGFFENVGFSNEMLKQILSN